MHPLSPTALLSLLLAAAGAACWAAHYRLAAVRAPALTVNPSDFNRELLALVPQLHEPYRPTPWLYNTHLQLAWLLLTEAVAPPLRYDRIELLRMRDGGTTALHWLEADCDSSAPILVVLHSIAGDDQSSRVLVRDLRRITGWRAVLCTRRGHGGLPLTAPVINTMGSTDDLREQLLHVSRQFPQSPLFAVGVSAGSALLVRYLGEEGGRSLIRAGVAYCPGYDVSVAWGRVQPFYSRAITQRLKQHFLLRHPRQLGHFDTYQACLATGNLVEFHEQLYQMAGCASHDEYLARSNPVLVFGGVAVPVMIVNADDDPVCVAENALDHLDAVARVPDALLVRTSRGSHCAFFEGWRPVSWANRLIAHYLLAASSLDPARPAAARET